MRAPRVVPLVFALAVSPSRAAAQQSPDLRWNAPPACPDRSHVLDALRRDTAALPTLPPRWRAEATVTTDGARTWTLQMTLYDGERVLGVRALRERDCRRLTEAAVVVMALSLEAVAQQPPPPVETPAPAQPAEAFDPEHPWTRRASPRPPRPPARTPWSLSLSVGVGTEFLSDRVGAWGGAFAVGVSLARWRAEFEAATWQSTTRTFAPGARAEVNVDDLALRLGRTFEVGVVRFDATLGLLVGLHRATATGITTPTRGSATLLAVMAAVRACLPLARIIGVCATLRPWFAPQSASFTVAPYGTVYDAGPVGLQGLLDVTARIP